MTKYQGWTNYETWVTRLWMDCDAKQYTKMRKAAESELRKAEGDRDAATIAFRGWLSDEIERQAPPHRPTLYQDLLDGAISAINFHELAVNWMEDIELTDELTEPPHAPEPTPKPATKTKAVASRSKHTLTATPEVLAILRAAEIDDEGLTLTGTLERHEYEAVNSFLDLAGAKWNRSKGRHLFKAGAKAKIDALLSSGQIVDEKKQFQAFYTPAEVAAELVALAEIEPGMKCLEPSAGAGAIALAARNAGAEVSTVEMNVEAANVLVGLGFHPHPVDFLTLPPEPVFDRVLMNPPFSGNQDIKHVRHAHRFLKPGGKLYAIMSPGFTFGGQKERAEFRNFLAEHGRVVKELEAGTFSESGTEVGTVIVELEAGEVVAEEADLFSFAAD